MEAIGHNISHFRSIVSNSEWEPFYKEKEQHFVVGEGVQKCLLWVNPLVGGSMRIWVFCYAVIVIAIIVIV